MEVSANNAASSKKPLQRNMLHRPVLLIIQQKAQLLISRIHLSKQAIIWKGRIVLSSQSGVAFLSVPHGWCHVYHTNRLQPLPIITAQVSPYGSQDYMLERMS